MEQSDQAARLNLIGETLNLTALLILAVGRHVADAVANPADQTRVATGAAGANILSHMVHHLAAQHLSGLSAELFDRARVEQVDRDRALDEAFSSMISHVEDAPLPTPMRERALRLLLHLIEAVPAADEPEGG